MTDRAPRVERARWILWVALAVLAVVPYLGALDNDFVFDDRVVVLKNPMVVEFRVGEIFAKPYWWASPATGLYRPLTTLGFAIDYAIGKGSAAPFIAVNILLHAASTLLAFLLLRRLFPDRLGIGWCAAALFAVHPLHVEAVAGVVGRAEVLSSTFVFASYLLWLRSERRPGTRHAALLPPLLWMAGLLSKESAVLLPALLFAHRRGWLPGTARGGLARRDLAWPGLFAVVFALRLNALGGLHPPGADQVDNPLASLGTIQRVLGAGGVLFRQLVQMFTGRNLSADYSYAAVLPGAQLYATGAVALAALAAACALAWRHERARRTLEAYGLAFFLTFWIVTSNVVLPIGTAQADRLLYLPLLGLLAAGASLIARFLARGTARTAAWTLLGLAIAAGAAGTVLRTRVWQNETTLFESAVATEPRSVKARWNLAVVLQRNEGERAARRVLDILAPVAKWAPTHGEYLHRQAIAYMFLGESAAADSLFRAALRAGAKETGDIRCELGNLALQRGDGEEALRQFDAVGDDASLERNVQIGRASALNILGRHRESASVWRGVVEALPDSIPVRIAYAVNLREAGYPAEAIATLQEGVARSSDGRLIDELAYALAVAGRRAEARALLPRVTDPDVRAEIEGTAPAMEH